MDQLRKLILVIGYFNGIREEMGSWRASKEKRWKRMCFLGSVLDGMLETWSGLDGVLGRMKEDWLGRRSE